MAHWVIKHCRSDMKYEIDEGICCDFGLPNKSQSFAEEPGYDVRDWKRQPLTIGLGPGQ